MYREHVMHTSFLTVVGCAQEPVSVTEQKGEQCVCALKGRWLQSWNLRHCLSNSFPHRQAKIFASENWEKLKEAQRDAFKTKAMTKWSKSLILDQEHFVHWIPVVLLPVYVPVYLVFYCTSIVNYNPLGRVQSGK